MMCSHDATGPCKGPVVVRVKEVSEARVKFENEIPLNSLTFHPEISKDFKKGEIS